MDKTFLPSYSPSQTTYVEAEAVGFSRFRFHRKRTASASLLPTSVTVFSQNTGIIINCGLTMRIVSAFPAPLPNCDTA